MLTAAAGGAQQLENQVLLLDAGYVLKTLAFGQFQQFGRGFLLQFGDLYGFGRLQRPLLLHHHRAVAAAFVIAVVIRHLRRRHPRRIRVGGQRAADLGQSLGIGGELFCLQVRV
jgi:hypothetical protein